LPSVPNNPPVRNAYYFPLLVHQSHCSILFPHLVVFDVCCLQETLFLTFNLLLSSLTGKYSCVLYSNTLVEFSRSPPDDSTRACPSEVLGCNRCLSHSHTANALRSWHSGSMLRVGWLRVLRVERLCCCKPVGLIYVMRNEHMTRLLIDHMTRLQV
jgi:hypothetical protein